MSVVNVRESKKIVATLSNLFAKEKEAAMQLSDYLYSLYQKYGRSETYRLAGEAGLGQQLVRQRIWVAETISMQNPLRKLPLSFCHLRVLAGIKDQDPVAWGQKATKEKWSVARLMREVEAMKPGADTDAVLLCGCCGEAFDTPEEIYRFSEPGEKAKPWHKKCILDRLVPTATRQRRNTSTVRAKAA